MTATLRDANDVPIVGFENVKIPATGVLDLRSLSADATHATVSASVTVEATSNEPWSGSVKAIVVADADPVQLCYQTRLANSCDLNGVGNTATDSVSGASVTTVLETVSSTACTAVAAAELPRTGRDFRRLAMVAALLVTLGALLTSGDALRGRRGRRC